MLSRYFEHCYPPGIIELRVPSPLLGTRYGFFSDRSRLVEVALTLSGTAAGVYASINCVKEELLARCDNHTIIQTGPIGVCRDEDIEWLTTLLIDIDPERAPDTSSTDQEHEASLARAQDVQGYLKEAHGWPDPVLLDSGNGYQLRYAIQLANVNAQHLLLKTVIATLGKKYNDNVVHVDPVTYNPSRVGKIPYTKACKGEPSVDRPHRMARIISMPVLIEQVALEQIQAVCDDAKASGASGTREPPRAAPRPSEAHTNGSSNGAGSSSSYQAFGLLEKALRDDPKFRRLFDGDISEHKSHSEADESLCSKLIYWFGPDRMMVDYLFRQSRMFRPEWDDPRPQGTYGSITIDAALREQTVYYDPEKFKEQKKQERQQQKHGQSNGAYCWFNIGSIWDKESHVTYAVSGIIPAAAVTLLTGDSGQGKSLFSTAVAGAMAWGKDFLGEPMEQRRVVYLDREQPLSVIKQHIFDLRIDRTDQLVYWDSSEPVPPDGPAAPSLIELAEKEKACFIFDPLVAFFHGSEQDANQTREVMSHFRNLANAGGTVIILHHSGKGESSKLYRGSSDIKAAVDVAWMVEKVGDATGLVSEMNLTPFKNRLGESKKIRLMFDGHEFSLSDKPPNYQEKLDDIIRLNPGLSGAKLTKLGMDAGIPKNKIEWLLAQGLESNRYFTREGGKGGGKRFYMSLVNEDEDD